MKQLIVVTVFVVIKLLDQSVMNVEIVMVIILQIHVLLLVRTVMENVQIWIVLELVVEVL